MWTSFIDLGLYKALENQYSSWYQLFNTPIQTKRPSLGTVFSVYCLPSRDICTKPSVSFSDRLQINCILAFNIFTF